MAGSMLAARVHSFLFFFNDTATTEIYTLSLHDALPISEGYQCGDHFRVCVQMSPGLEKTRECRRCRRGGGSGKQDRKSTRLNSSHVEISYAVFCLKKKKRSDSKCAAPTVDRLRSPCSSR